MATGSVPGRMVVRYIIRVVIATETCMAYGKNITTMARWRGRANSRTLENMAFGMKKNSIN
jgi:hypothetical protein